MQPLRKGKKSKADKLARVRNNQRRCRERKHNYVAELVEKVRHLEAGDRERVIEQASNQYRQENEMLKRLLGSLGLKDAFVNAYLQAAIRAPTAMQSVSLQQELPSNTLSDFHMLSTSPELPSGYDIISSQFTQRSASPWTMFAPESLDPGQHDPNESATRNDDTLTLFNTVDSLPGLSLDIPSSLIDPPCINLQDDPLLAASATTDHLNALLHPVSAGVTLCSIAYSLVLQHNKKGYDLAQLDVKLQVGYTGRSISAGCTVDNKVLFGVLAEIS